MALSTTEYQEIRHTIVLGDRLGTTSSSTGLQQFIKRFNRLYLHIEAPRAEHSVSARFEWVVRDKEKFSSLLNALAYFISRLNAFVPAQEQSGSTITEQDLVKDTQQPATAGYFQGVHWFPATDRRHGEGSDTIPQPGSCTGPPLVPIN